MKKTKVIVPDGIRYISEWKEFSIPNHPCIINKQITGCGFTEFCITNNENVILCSPRKILLENKEEQHPEVLYVRNEFEKDLGVDKDLTSAKPERTSEELDDGENSADLSNLTNQIKDYCMGCLNSTIPCKVLVTYDSFRLVKEAIQDLGLFNMFRVVVDEFQSIFTDSKFKSTTEIEFLTQLQGVEKLCFVSATPMMDEYLEELDEFKDLPFYALDWEESCPGRVVDPMIRPYTCPRGIIQPACDIVAQYKAGEFLSTVTKIDGKLVETVSKEAVFYVNSVKNICDIIHKSELTLEETNVLCARTPENEKKLRKAFGVKKGVEVFGKVPTRGEQHKMFTLCTRTVYLGADFYSTCARSFIFSDANIDSLTVDIKLDIPQILGRQRLDCNPWKNKADLYCKTISSGKIITQEESDRIMAAKKSKTMNLLLSYNTSPTPEAKHDLAEKYQKDIKYTNYRDDYVAVNTHGGKDLVPVENKLVEANDRRSYKLQQGDYKDMTRVFSALGNTVRRNTEASKILSDLSVIPYFNDKMKYIYGLSMPDELAKLVLDNIEDTDFSKYYWTISPERAGTLKYVRKNLEAEYRKMHMAESYSTDTKEAAEVYLRFSVGEKYTKTEIKSILGEIYVSTGYSKTPKASDLEDYFELKSCQITNKETGKRDHGFEIIKKKD